MGLGNDLNDIWIELKSIDITLKQIAMLMLIEQRRASGTIGLNEGKELLDMIAKNLLPRNSQSL